MTNPSSPVSSLVNAIVKNVRLASFNDPQSIFVRRGIVESIKPANNNESYAELPEDCKIIDAQQCIAAPGLIDLYTRVREPGYTRKGTIASESAAAHRAGFTRILCSPDTAPVVDSVATVELIRQRAAINPAGTRIIPMAALTISLQGEKLTELATLQAAGCPVATQADTPLLSTTVLYSAMEYAASFDLPLLMTARDAQIGAEGCAHAGATATRLGLPQVPIAAETVALATLIELCRDTQCQIHISRVSSARAVQHINDAKQSGLPITCDVGIHHLFYTDELLAGYDSAFHSAVPFRSRTDRQALREGLKSGIIDAICSDHAPQDIDASLAPFPDTDPGLSAYDWFIPLLMQVPCITGLSLNEVFDKLTSNPAKLINEPRQIGIHPGQIADFFVLDSQSLPAAIESTLSLGKNNPLASHSADELGLQALQGRVRAVVTESSVTQYS